MKADAASAIVLRIVFAALLVATAVALPACMQSNPGARPVAVWDGGRLEQGAFEAWAAWQQLEPSRASVRKLALIESLAEEALSRGLADSPGVRLAAEASRQAMLLPELENHIDAQVKITNAEIAELRATYPEAFHQPRKLFLRGIYKRLPTDEAQRAEVRRRMGELRRRVIEGVDLAELASRESESQSRFRGGSIGFVAPAALPGVVRRGVEDLEPGGISPLIEHAGGLAFYRCERIRPASIPDADQVRHKFRQNLFRQRSAERKRALQEELAARIHVTPDEDPVLTVGDYVLPADALDALVRQRLPDRDPESLTAQQKRWLLQEWGQRVARADYAESLGLAGSGSQATAMRWHRTHALATAELRRRVDSRLRPPSEAKLRELYEQRRDHLQSPLRYRIAAIQFTDAAGLKQRPVVERARELLDHIRSGELTFARVARDVSVHATAGEGGLLGWMTQRQLGGLDMGMLKPVRQLSPGEDTGLLRLQSGLWLVKLLDRQPSSPKTFEQAREQLKQSLRQESVEQLEKAVREQHLASMNLRILAY